MGLVDGEGANIDAAEKIAKISQHQALGRDEQEPHRSLQDILLVGASFHGGQGAIDLDGRHAAGLQAVHLVLHEGNERRDDDGGAAADDGRGLVAERLAAAGGHDDEGIAAGQDRAHGLLLQGPEGAKAPVPFDDLAQRVERVCRGSRGHAFSPERPHQDIRKKAAGPDWASETLNGAATIAEDQPNPVRMLQPVMEPTRLQADAIPPRIGLWDAVSIIVGIIIGVGIFRTPVDVLTRVAGPWEAMGLWLLGGLLALVGALCFAELAATYPRSGGEYVYITRAYGSRISFLYAWAQFTVIRPGSIAAVAYVFAEHADKQFGIGLCCHRRDRTTVPHQRPGSRSGQANTKFADPCQGIGLGGHRGSGISLGSSAAGGFPCRTQAVYGCHDLCVLGLRGLARGGLCGRRSEE